MATPTFSVLTPSPREAAIATLAVSQAFAESFGMPNDPRLVEIAATTTAKVAEALAYARLIKEGVAR